MEKEIDFDLFKQAEMILEDTDDNLAQQLLKEVHEAYEMSGRSGVEELFLEIREKYIGET